MNFEETDEVLITVSATDEDGNTVSRLLQIPVRDVNEAPINLGVDSAYVPPGKSGLRIGGLSVEDPDIDDVHSFEVIGDDRFIIADGVLSLADDVALDADTEVALTIIATDSGGLSTRAVLRISTIAPSGPTSSSIQLLAPDNEGIGVEIEPAACEASTASPSRALDGGFRDNPTDGLVMVDGVDAYAIGDAIYIRVDDPDENIDPESKEAVSVVVSSSATSDEETVMLFESGTDSGVFVGFVFSTSQQSTRGDCVVSVASRSEVAATYLDPDDQSDTNRAVAPISPVGIVFNEETGEPVDGVILTLVSVDQDRPADVRGDGPDYALYPSAVVSGETVQDRIGGIYDHGSGEYRFPAVPAGRYRFEIFNTREFEFSDRPDDELQALGAGLIESDGRFKLGPASRGEPFHVSQGAIPRIDIPVRIKTEPDVMQSESSIEFLQYSPVAGVGETYNVQQAVCVAGQSRQISELRNVSVPVPGLVSLMETDVIKAGRTDLRTGSRSGPES
ncbi:MAG: hypothetical protein U5O39_15305 [Gammaproteobacteria bacterium]|nr:hypothetical protein [Gammaproteobacteria bacterium]